MHSTKLPARYPCEVKPLSHPGNPTCTGPSLRRQSAKQTKRGERQRWACTQNDGLISNPTGPKQTNAAQKHVLERTCIALIGHLKPRNVAIATMDSAATAVDSWKVKKFLML